MTKQSIKNLAAFANALEQTPRYAEDCGCKQKVN